MRGAVLNGGVIAGAMGIMNVTTYAFTILAARLLGPAEYGSLAAVMGVLLVVNVLSLGLQATGARRVSANPADLPDIRRQVMATSYVAALVLGGIVLAVSPVLTILLDLDSWLSAALVGVTAVPLTIMGAQAGLLQGQRRWGPLAAIYLTVGLGRISFGAVALVVDPDTLGAMIGVASGAFIPVVIGWLALRQPDRQRPPAAEPPPVVTPRWERGGVLNETMHNSHALLAFFALSNVDVLVARITLDAHQAGLYAGGLILAKAVLFLPQFVVVVAFPAMARTGAGRRMHLISLGLVLAMGAATVLGVLVLSWLAVVFVGGPEYAEIEDELWAFAVLGTLLATIQLLIYNIVARQRQRTVLLVWAALAALLCAAPFIDSMTGLLTVVVAVDAILFLGLFARSLTASYLQSPTVPPIA